jgi:hypothetical protein
VADIHTELTPFICHHAPQWIVRETADPGSIQPKPGNPCRDAELCTTYSHIQADDLFEAVVPGRR